jgi:hypothetical protein
VAIVADLVVAALDKVASRPPEASAAAPKSTTRA